MLPKRQQDRLEEGIRSGKVPLLGESDRFRFSCTSCGKCCFGQRILLTPMDIALLAASAWARARGLTSTRDLHGHRLLRRFVDERTREPLCMIRVDAPDAPCPFLEPEVAYASQVQRKMVEHHVGLGRHRVEAVKLAGLTATRLLCGLHDDGTKPMVCKGAPIGRVHDQGKIAFIIEPPHPECPGMRESKEWTVQDWIRASRLEDQYKEAEWYADFMERNEPRFATMGERRLEWIGGALYDPDGVAIDLGMPAAPSRTLNPKSLVKFSRGLAEAFAAEPDEDFADGAVPTRRAGDLGARVTAALQP